jgi:hypothetical protein
VHVAPIQDLHAKLRAGRESRQSEAAAGSADAGRTDAASSIGARPPSAAGRAAEEATGATG